MIDPTLLPVALLLLAVAVLVFLAYRGTIPRWLAAVLAAVAVLVGLLRGRRRPGPAGPPPMATTEPVRRTAADILSERAAADRARIQAAAGGPAPETDVASLADARKRRPR